MESFWQIFGEFYWGGNSGQDYAMALFLFIVVLFGLKFFQIFVLSRLNRLAEKTATDLDDTVIKIFKELKPPFYFLIALLAGLKFLSLSDWLDGLVNIIFLVVVVYEIIRAFDKLINYSLQKYFSRRATNEREEKNSITMVKTLAVIIRMVLWVVGIIVVLSNAGINVSSLVASLGIGGIAVALAIQNILSDLFSSFSIFMDKPFQVGDFIILGKDMGTVERIGLKTTRLRSLTGEELVVSNKELTSVRVQNFGRLQQRRVVFTLGVTYQTPAESLEKIPGLIKEIIDNQPEVDFDRCHFKELNASSLDFEIVFYVNSPDYAAYMDVREKINLAIIKKFAALGIEFAYPTQTVYVSKN